MKRITLFGIAALASTAGHAQTEQDVLRFERHVETHDLTPQGNCVVSFSITTAGYIATMNLSKCPAKDQRSALTRLGAALPFPASSTVSRDVSLRL
jgi:hypothetical protein